MSYMDYNIHLENFDGPLDLLLHLVKETKLDIYEINMSSIIESYLKYISDLQSLDIDVGSEFLLMASSLLHLKSKMLIGKTTETEESEDEYAIESEEDLKQRIIEYEKYKNITKELKALEEKRKEVYTKLPESLKEYMTVPELFNENNLTVDDLVKALRNVEARLQYKEPVETRITSKEISVKERATYIRDILKIKKKCDFTELFEFGTKDYIIATFLAILEMCKTKELKLTQENSFDSIIVEAIA